MAQNTYNRRKTTKRNTDREIPGWILAIFSSFLFLCAAVPIALGPISGAVYAFLLGTFGFAVYPILVCVFTMGVYFIQNRKLAVPKLYAVCSAFIGLMVIFILHLAMTYSMLGTRSFAEYMGEVFNGPATGGIYTAGGIVFGTFVYGIQAAVTPVFSFIVFALTIAALTFVMLNRHFDFMGAMKKRRQNECGRSFQKGDRDAAPVRRVADRDLFVETIRPKASIQSSSSYGYETTGGTFSELSQSNSAAELEAANYGVAPAMIAEGAEDKRAAAREILFGNRDSTTQLSPFSVYPFTSAAVSIPQSVLSAPDIKQQPQLEKSANSVSEKPPIIVHNTEYHGLPPTVPVFPEKSLTYVPGEIVNGETESVRIAEKLTPVSSQADSVPLFSQPNPESFVESRPIIERYQEPQQPRSDELRSNVQFRDSMNPAELQQSSETDYRDTGLCEYANLYTDDGFITHKIELPKISQRQEIPTPKESVSIRPLSGDRYSSFESDVTDHVGIAVNHGVKASETPVQSTESVVQSFSAESETVKAVRNDHSGYYTPIEEVPIVMPSQETRSRRSLRSLSPENQVQMEKYMATAAQTPQTEAPAPKSRRRHSRYNPPPIELLIPSKNAAPDDAEADVQERARMLENTLDGLKLPAKVSAITRGPSVTRYELEMPHGIPIKRIEQYVTDIEYYLASNGKIRLETPIPGKRAVGIEVPNAQIDVVGLRDVIQSTEFSKASSPLSLAVGKDIAGANIICELNKMPHLLIAGATGSGKSACLNSIIMSLVYKSSPEDVRLILIDPKHVEFTMYKNLPHLLTGEIINDGQQALNAFKWLKNEMDRRYLLFAKNYVRDLPEFNKCAAVRSGEESKLPYIVLIVDELAELMMSQNRKDLEEKIMSMAQKARASGIHLILATQRPTVDVITGTIKANLPSRIAFSVKSVIDSRTILDSAGAETLLGRGDMLYAPIGVDDPRRVQGAFVTNEEVASVIEYVKMNNEGIFDDEFKEAISASEESSQPVSANNSGEEDTGFDPLAPSVLKLVIETGTVSTSFIQRRFAVGYSRAARIIDQMEQSGFIGPLEGGKPRAVYITRERFIEVFGPEKYAEVFGEEFYES